MYTLLQSKSVFQYLYQYHGDPLVTFTNTANTLIVQFPIFIKHKRQVPMFCYYIKTVPFATDMDSCLGTS